MSNTQEFDSEGRESYNKIVYVITFFDGEGKQMDQYPVSGGYVQIGFTIFNWLHMHPKGRVEVVQNGQKRLR